MYCPLARYSWRIYNILKIQMNKLGFGDGCITFLLITHDPDASTAKIVPAQKYEARYFA